jgi:5,10-methylenetetrahydromethanopterin reductase
MRICAGIGTEVVGGSSPPRQLVEDIRSAEEAGFPSAWVVHFSRGIDALSTLAVAAACTSTIDLAVGIVPTWPRHPVALAQQAATVQALAGGRFTLGVGVSHKPGIEGMHGIPFVKPAQHMREYLSVLGPLLETGAVRFEGELYQVDAAFAVPGTSRVSVVVGALSPLMVQAAGELADGTVTWLVGPKGLDDVVPNLQKAASSAGRGTPRVVVGLPVLVCDDVAAGRAWVNQVFARYAGLENYQRQFAREGVEGPGDVAVVGDEASVEQQLRTLASAGATELWPTIFDMDGQPGSGQRSAALLRSLAPDMS